MLDAKPVAGAPASYWAGESGGPGAVHGYMDIALHPRFAENHLVYVTYTKPLDGSKRTTAIARGRWVGSALAPDVKERFCFARSGYVAHQLSEPTACST